MSRTVSPAIDALKSYAPEGSTVYTILRHVSSSGMSRDISVIAITDGKPRNLDGLVLQAGIGRKSRRRYGEGVRVAGVGMDMGFALVYRLAQVLYGDGYALDHEWL